MHIGKMKSVSCLFFLVLVLALWPRRILTHGGASINNHLAMLTEACARTPYKDVCTSAIKDEQVVSPNGNAALDLRNAAKIAVKVAWTIASETQDQMKKMLNDPALKPFLQQCLMDCDATYDDAVANLEEAYRAFDAKGYEDIEKWVAAAAVDPQTCEDFFKEVVGYTSPVTSMNNAVVQLSNAALALIKLVADEQQH